MQKYFRSLLRYLYLSFIAVLLLFSLVFALLQTKWAKLKIAENIAALSTSSNVTISIGKVKGSLPFTWHIDHILFTWGEEESLELYDVKIRFAIFPLINKNCIATYFNIEHAHLSHSFESTDVITLDAIKQRAKLLINALSIPYRIAIDRLKINAFTCENATNKKTSRFFLIAQLDLGKQWRHLYTHVTLSPRGHPDNVLQVDIEANKKLDYASFSLKTQLSSLEPFQPFFSSIPLECMNLDCSLNGPWMGWNAFFHDTPFPSSLLGLCHAELHPISDVMLFNRLFSFDAKFTLNTFHSLNFQSCELKSDAIACSFNGVIEQDLKKSVGQLSMTLPSLSLFTNDLLTGSLAANATYADGQLISDIFTDRLQCKGVHLEPLNAHITAHIEDHMCKGRADLCTQGGPLPIQGTWDFTCNGSRLSLNHISIAGPSMQLAGNVDIDWRRFLYTGALYGQIEHLDPLAWAFASNRIDAQLGFECEFSENESKQKARCHILGRNAIFNDYFLDHFSLTASINDLFDMPLGKMHFVAQGLHTPYKDIHLIECDTSSQDDAEWPFFLRIEGAHKEPFSLQAKGKWKKEEDLFSLELISLEGQMLSYPIYLQQSCLLEKAPQFLSLSPLHLKLGEAELFATCDVNTIRSTAQINAYHFPLSVVSLFYPRYALDGALSLKGHLDASEDRIEGALNAVLEEIEFLHSDKKEPFLAKGSLQMHIDRGILQTHAYLTATYDQFIDWTATLPIVYDRYPLHLALDMHKPVSSELIAEGRLQDLFDFINLGIHRATGHVSSRLFLSHTLSSPIVQGSIEWHEGTYENFLTGTALQDIQATLHAESHELHLTSFVAKDEKKGRVHGDGIIELNPQAHFPYRFIAELDNLHAVHFNPIDCHLSGPLYLFGTLREAFAEGNLLVSQAEFKIPDHLPLDIPILPVTFINAPLSLSSTTLLPRPAFPFHIQLELTAEDHVLVTGKGLNSEWKGSLLLSGTNMNVLANGTLHLIKGEYDLFGKTFKLQSGQIIFNDKPTPSATINLNGNLTLADTVITAHLRGPLSSPTLTFQSNPQLSTSAILARILFNKDISDISQPEAVQLATTLISLSGGTGPSVLETIRKNLGVDRLTIASQTARPDEIAIQIGKYLTKGVLITLSQSATSSQVIVEVEFNYGFVFQAETQEEQEGKFSLKWTHSY